MRVLQYFEASTRLDTRGTPPGRLRCLVRVVGRNYGDLTPRHSIRVPKHQNVQGQKSTWGSISTLSADLLANTHSISCGKKGFPLTFRSSFPLGPIHNFLRSLPFRHSFSPSILLFVTRFPARTPAFRPLLHIHPSIPFSAPLEHRLSAREIYLRIDRSRDDLNCC